MSNKPVLTATFAALLWVLNTLSAQSDNSIPPSPEGYTLAELRQALRLGIPLPPKETPIPPKPQVPHNETLPESPPAIFEIEMIGFDPVSGQFTRLPEYEQPPISSLKITSILPKLYWESDQNSRYQVLSADIGGQFADHLSQYSRDKVTKLFVYVDGKATSSITLTNKVNKSFTPTPFKPSDHRFKFRSSIRIPRPKGGSRVVSFHSATNAAGLSSRAYATIILHTIEKPDIFPIKQDNIVFDYTNFGGNKGPDVRVTAFDNSVGLMNLQTWVFPNSPFPYEWRGNPSHGPLTHLAVVPTKALEPMKDNSNLKSFECDLHFVFTNKMSTCIHGERGQRTVNGSTYFQIGKVTGFECVVNLTSNIAKMTENPKWNLVIPRARKTAGIPKNPKMLIDGTEFNLINIKGPDGKKSYYYPENPTQKGTPNLFLFYRYAPEILKLPTAKKHSPDAKESWSHSKVEIKVISDGQMVDRSDYTFFPLSDDSLPRPPSDANRKSQTPTEHQVISAYYFIYGHIAEKVLGELEENDLVRFTFNNAEANSRQGFKDNQHFIEIGLRDANVVDAAQELFTQIHQILPTIQKELIDYDRHSAFQLARFGAVKIVAQRTSLVANLYLAGITLASEPLDWVLATSEILDGNYYAAAAYLPFIVTASTKARGIKFKLPDGTEFTLFKGLAATQRKRVVNAIRGAQKLSIKLGRELMAKAGLKFNIRKKLYEIGILRVGHHGQLRDEMIKSARASGKTIPKNKQAHHVLPYQFRNKFAAHGFDVNNPAYGKWLSPSIHRRLHNHHKYNLKWKSMLDEIDEALQKGTISERQARDQIELFISQWISK
ncbi:MAG: hypothetical protein H8E27_10265 [Verrucomicrobia subdivision 3 bacterium]|nr:hypothetical protein [Limisphaerales bacterium]